ncbi:MAG TPA: ribulose-phosphate 3-epimerase [Terriglobia bacterium]|nr:ribulose-phosphate 3-epimerase [Terriglobia bacterium]
MTIRIAPSILSANFAALGEDIRKVEEAGADLLHIDVMDGHFVPNITIGPPVVKSIKRIATKPLDVHLMITNPDQYIAEFANAGASIITVHAEASIHLDRTLNFIRSHNVRAGVSINPATPLSAVEHALDLADMLLIMSVNPGFGGQKYIPYVTDKIRHAREIINRRQLRCAIEVDGGIDIANMPEVVAAGAQILVAGSAIFGDPDPARKLREMLAIAGRLSYHSNVV